MYHIPILKDYITDFLEPDLDKTILDCTLGGAGHTKELLKRGARVVGVDRDADAIENAKGLSTQYGDRFLPSMANFKDIDSILDKLGIDKVDGALMDLGISSHQIDMPERGFSYRFDAPLDMRMDLSQPLSAMDVVNTYSESELKRIFFEYGEERYSARVAASIVKLRPIKTTGELNEIIARSVKFSKNDGHPSKRVFQALRIEVNGELNGLDQAIRDVVNRLKSGGKLAILSFHSLEDRIVKQVLRELATDCVCDKRLPVCVCSHKAVIELFGKVVTPSQEELAKNPRAKSAKLRMAIKL